MFEARARAGEIADGEQKEKNRQRAENDLQGEVQAQRADKHDSSEHSPNGEIRGHRRLVGRRAPSQFRQDNQRHQRQPEEAVGNEGGGGEGIAFPPFHDAGDDLRGATVTNAHRQHHAVEFIEAGVVQVEQHGRHAKAEQPQRSRIPRSILDLSDGFVHVQFVEGLESKSVLQLAATLLKERSTM